MRDLLRVDRPGWALTFQILVSQSAVENLHRRFTVDQRAPARVARAGGVMLWLRSKLT
jgi:hypothetical protein